MLVADPGDLDTVVAGIRHLSIAVLRFDTHQFCSDYGTLRIDSGYDML